MLRFNAIHQYNLTENVDQSHQVDRQLVLGVSALVTFNDAGSNGETIIWNGLTWTGVTAGATGRQFNLGGTADLSAAAFAAAVTAHADNTTYQVVADSGTATITHRTNTGLLSNVTGTFNTTTDFETPTIPNSGAQAAVIFNDAVATTKLPL